jgi:hypothetical protein
MPAKTVPVTYGLDTRWGLRQLIDEKFPFSFENISGGCLVDSDPDPLMPTTGKRYVCPKCVTAWKRWSEAALKKANEKKPK